MQDFDEAIRLNSQHTSAFYNKACCYALQGHIDPAIECLRQSLELGWIGFDHMAKNSDLDSIRDDPRYKELVKKYAK